MRRLAAIVGAWSVLFVAPAHAVQVVGAGEIASDGNGDRKTSKLVLALDPVHVLTFGDNAYPDGSRRQYSRFYDPTWGRFKGITKPAPGNHDWHTPGAAGYEAYFGRAFPAGRLVVYERLVPGWDVYQLDTMKRLPAQVRRLDRRLDANPDRCELVYGHHPRWSSGKHGDDRSKQPLWATLVAHGVDLYLSGHDHDYERFAKMDARGSPSAGGTRSVVVGTGGAATRRWGRASDGATQARLTGNANWGVLDLNLKPRSYDAEFRRAAAGGRKVADRFGSRCHR